MPHHPVDPDQWFDDVQTTVWRPPRQPPQPPRRVPCATPVPQAAAALRPLRPVAPIAPVYPPQTLARPRRRWLRRLLLIAAVAAALVVAGLFAAVAYVRGQVRAALPALSARLDRPVTAGDIDVSWGVVTIHDLEVSDLAAVDRVVVRFTVTDLLGGRVRLDAIDAHGVSADIDRATVEDLLARVAARAADQTDAGSGHGRVDASAAVITAHDITVKAADPARDVAATFSVATATPIDGGVSITGASIADVGGDSRLAALLRANPVAGVSGSLSRDGGELRFNLAGRFGDDERWRASGSARGRDDAEVRLGGSGVALRRALDALTALGRPTGPIAIDDRARIGGDLTVAISPREVIARGTVELDAVSLDNRRLALEPIALTGSVDLDVSADRRGAWVRVDRAVWRAAAAPKVEWRLSGSAQRAPERTLVARLEVPRARCADVLASVPAAMVPGLQGFELSGEVDGHLDVAIDWSQLEKTTFDGSIAIDDCQVLSAPKAMSADRLRGSFEHSVTAGGIHKTFVIGRENPDFVPVDHVSRHLIRSLLTTEDGSFWRHKGFRLDAFRTAVIRNLQQGRFAYGGSSITMQMVKNVMLGRQKTVSRKLQELFLTWYVERELPKKRILEIYLNAIEFGPGLYGIKPAARQYFGKHPRRLNPVESAFFSSILPAPRRRFAQYCRGYIGGWTRNKMDRIIDLMFDRNRLDPDAYLTAIETPLIFRGKRRELCKYLDRKGAK